MGSMNAILKESVQFNGLTFEPGTIVRFERKILNKLENIPAQHNIVADVNVGRYPVKILVKKSQIEFNAVN